MDPWLLEGCKFHTSFSASKESQQGAGVGALSGVQPAGLATTVHRHTHLLTCISFLLLL